MNTQERIADNLKTAMKAHQAFEVGLLRLLQSALHNKLIEKHAKGASELSEDDVIGVLKSELKKRREAAEVFTRGGRADLTEKEKAEADLIARYLPEELSPEKIREVVIRILAEGGGNDFGSAMKRAMGELKGKADGRLVGEIIKKELAAKNETVS